MSNILATEQGGRDERAEPQDSSVLEAWSTNERMRHIPPLPWMIQKLDGDLRRRIEILCAPVEMLFSDDGNRAAADRQLRAVCTALERLAEIARHARGAHPPNELTRHVVWSVGQAVGALRTLDPDLIGRRFPFQTFERSKAEPLYAAFLQVIAAVDRLTDAIRAIDPEVDGRILEPLVQLSEPMREDAMA